MCDGFIGNVALKISEGVADAIKKLLIKEISGSFLGRLAYPLIAAPLMKLKRRIDYAEFGGAPLLGVNGITMICHGRSSAKAIKNAIRRAKGLAESRVDELIQRDIEEEPFQSRPAEEPSVMRSRITGTGSYCAGQDPHQCRLGKNGRDIGSMDHRAHWYPGALRGRCPERPAPISP